MSVCIWGFIRNSNHGWESKVAAFASSQGQEGCHLPFWPRVFILDSNVSLFVWKEVLVPAWRYVSMVGGEWEQDGSAAT